MHHARVSLPRTLFFKKCPISKTLQDTFPGHFLRPAVSILFLLRKVFINVLSKKCLIPYCAVLFFILINLCNKKVSSPILCRFIVYTFQSVQQKSVLSHTVPFYCLYFSICTIKKCLIPYCAVLSFKIIYQSVQ